MDQTSIESLLAWADGDLSASFGKQRYGRALRNKEHEAANPPAPAQVAAAA